MTSPRRDLARRISSNSSNYSRHLHDIYSRRQSPVRDSLARRRSGTGRSDHSAAVIPKVDFFHVRPYYTVSRGRVVSIRSRRDDSSAINHASHEMIPSSSSSSSLSPGLGADRSARAFSSPRGRPRVFPRAAIRYPYGGGGGNRRKG